MTTTLVIDPGAKPGYVWSVGDLLPRGPAWRDLSLPSVDEVWVRNRGIPTPEVLVCEAQELRSGKDPRGIFKLARTAGMQAGRFRMPTHWLTPNVWRTALRLTSLTKEQVQARVLDALTPEERKRIRSTDCLDAVAILWAAHVLGGRLLEYREDPP